MFGQAFVHFIGRDWKSASAAVGLCESLVTDIVAALDSATVITVRSFILLAEISQYKVDMNVLHSTIDMILGTPTSSSTSTHAHQRDSSNAAGITPLIPISLLNTDSNAARNSDSTINNNNNNNNNNMNDINDTKLQQKNDHNISTADGGAFVDAGRAFQYHHRALFVYYAIIMSSLTILESSKFDIRKEKEKEKEKKIKKSQKMKKEKNMKYNTLDANSFGSMSSMISKKLRRATSSFLSRTSYSSSSSSTDSSPTASSSQQQQKQQHNDASTTERSSTLSNTFDTSKSFNENKTKLNAKSIGKYKNDAVSECSCNYR